MPEPQVSVFEVALAGAPLEALGPLLTEDEKERASRFHFRRDRDAFVAAHAALRLVLATRTRMRPSEVRLSRGAHGKPSIATRPGLQFNLSHSGQFAMIATASDGDVGVDIEAIDPQVDAIGLSERFFSVPERDDLRTLRGTDRSRGFFNAWTRKEAYLKARGDGIAFGLDHFDVALVPGQRPSLRNDRRDPDAPMHWSIVDLNAPDGYAAALAINGPAPSVTYCRFDWAAGTRMSP